ncbi:MAG: alpha/beta fold hydrolase [Halioglobus sp.]
MSTVNSLRSRTLTTLNYTVTGNTEAPWVTLAHSLATDMRMWESQVSILQRHYRVLCYDARGHGESPLGNDLLTMETLVSDVIELWDTLEVIESHFIGLSMGGMTGAGLALQHPKRVSSLIACDCRLDAPPQFVDMWEQRIEAVSRGGMEAAVDAILDTWLCNTSEAGRELTESLARELILATPAATYIACAHAIKTLDYKKHLGDLRVPVLYIVGEQDGPHPDAMAELQAQTPDASLVVLVNAAHLSNLDQPDTFNEAMEGFLLKQDGKPKGLTPLEIEHWSSSLVTIAEDMKGAPINVHKLMANNPSLLSAWWTFRTHSVAGGTLGRRAAELAVLRVSVHVGSWYEWASHVDRALDAGISSEEIAAILQYDISKQWTASEATVLQSVDELSCRHAICPDTLAALEIHFTPDQIMDLIAIHGMYITLAGMLLTWDLPLDQPVRERVSEHTDKKSFINASERFVKQRNEQPQAGIMGGQTNHEDTP